MNDLALMDSNRDPVWSARARSRALADLQAKAAQGDAEAQYDLGAHHYRASLDKRHLEPAESKIEAYKWFHLAAAQGYRDAHTLSNLVQLTMGRSEYEEGKRRAAAFATLAVRQPVQELPSRL
jgi:TPR repeat protein